jgi:hypothetical protein
LEGNALNTIRAMLDIADGNLVNNVQLTNAANTVQMDSNGKTDQKAGSDPQVHPR